MKRFLFFLALLLPCGLSSNLKADCLDSSNWYRCETTMIDILEPFGEERKLIGSGSSAFPNRGIGQSFRSLYDSRLSRVHVMMRRIDIPAENLMFRLYEMGTYGQPLPDPIFEYEFLRWFARSNYDYPTEIDFRFIDEAVYLEENKDYYFSLFPEEGDDDWQYEVAYNSSDIYTDGRRYDQWRDTTGWAFQSSGDLNFRMFVAVPEPATGFLLLPIGMVLINRRNRRRSQPAEIFSQD